MMSAIDLSTWNELKQFLTKNGIGYRIEFFESESKVYVKFININTICVPVETLAEEEN